MGRRAHPEFHQALLDPARYPSASRKIKFEETEDSYFYKTGEDVYKIRKTNAVYSNLAIKEAFVQEALVLGRRWAPQLNFETLHLVRVNGEYAFSSRGDPEDFVLRLTQLSAPHWLDHRITAGRCNSTAIGRLARYLATQHQAYPAPSGTAESAGRPEHLRDLADEVFYQAKKYTPTTLTEPMLEVIIRPTLRFLEDFRKLFLKRIRNGRIVDGHGAFTPDHIHMRGKEVLAVGPLDGQAKFRILDAANDVAALVNDLLRSGENEFAALFIKRYSAAAKDRDLDKILPIYQVFQGMRRGLIYSELLAEGSGGEERRGHWLQMARAHFNLAVQHARNIPRV